MINELDLSSIIKLRKSMEEIVEGINLDAPEIERFMKVYERLAYKINYDEEDFLYIKTDGAEGKSNKNAHNMIGGLHEDLCVCEGFAKMMNILLTKNIDIRILLLN